MPLHKKSLPRVHLFTTISWRAFPAIYHLYSGLSELLIIKLLT